MPVIYRRRIEDGLCSELLADLKNRKIEVNVEESEKSVSSIAPSTPEAFRFSPSRELAWTLAVIASGGSVNLNRGSIILDSSNDDLQKAFISRASSLFKSNLTWKINKNRIRFPQFFNIKAAKELGNLSKLGWVDTIIDKHGWVTESEDYMWAFLAGLFDDRGDIESKPRFKGISFYSAYRKNASFIAELLTLVGIKDPAIINNRSQREGIQGTLIRKLGDIQLFAHNVTSVIPEKNRLLQRFRGEPMRLARTRRSKNSNSPDKDELLIEWMRLFNSLGHVPNSIEISELYTEGKTLWSANVYSRAFGVLEESKWGLFSVATKNLAALHCIPYVRHIRSGNYGVRFDQDVLIDQYRTIRAFSLQKYGRLPTTPDISEVKRSGKISYGRTTLASRFGNGSITEAIRNLEDILFSIDTNRDLMDVTHVSGIEVKYVPKTHYSPQDKAKNLLESILNPMKGETSSPFLYDHRGQKLL